jgi:hypothetical protein
VSAKQRLDRLRHLREMAANLHRSILDECDMSQAEVAAIDKQIAESDKRCEALEQMVTWDGDQPDFWSLDGKIWKRATAADAGKMVRVNNRASCKPTESPEAKLIGIAHGWMCCEGSKGQIVEWKYAWIESDHVEEDEQPEDETKGYISIQVGSFYPGEPSLPVVKEEDDVFIPDGLANDPRFKLGDAVKPVKPSPEWTKDDWNSWFEEIGHLLWFSEGVITDVSGDHSDRWLYVVDGTEHQSSGEFLEPVLHQVAKDRS